MNIIVNNTPVLLLLDSVSLNQFLLEYLSEEHRLSNVKNCAVAINNNVIAKNHWSETLLNEGDSISVFTAIAGG